MEHITAKQRITKIRELLSKLPPEHTCKDARPLSQIYFDNKQHAARRRRLKQDLGPDLREIDLSLEENAEDDV